MKANLKWSKWLVRIGSRRLGPAMAILKHISTLLSKKAIYSQNITDFELIDTAQGTVLVAVSNKGAGLTSFMLNGGGYAGGRKDA